MSRDLTPDEQNAVNTLNRLAKRWPKTIKLFSWSGTLVIFDADDTLSRPGDTELAVINRGIISDGGDPGDGRS